MWLISLNIVIFCSDKLSLQKFYIIILILQTVVTQIIYLFMLYLVVVLGAGLNSSKSGSNVNQGLPNVFGNFF